MRESRLVWRRWQLPGPVSFVARPVQRPRRAALAVVGAASLITGMVVVLAPASSAASTGYAVTEAPLNATVAVSVASDPTTDTVYAATSSPPGIAVINGQTNTVTGQISLPFVPRLVMTDPAAGTLYAFSFPGAGVAMAEVINEATEAVTATISLPAGVDPSSAAADPMTGTVYLTDVHGSVLVISGSTVTADIPLADPVLAPNASLHGVAVDPATKTIYVADSPNSQVDVISTTTDTLTSRISLPAGSGPIGVAVDPSTGQVYVADLATGMISVIDAATGGVSTLVTGLTEPAVLALDTGTDTLYAVSETSGVTSEAGDPGTTYAIDTSTGAIADQIPRGGLSAALAPASGGSLYVTDYAGSPAASDVTVLTPSTANTMSPLIIGGTTDPNVTINNGEILQDQFTASATPAATFTAAGLPAGVTMSPSGLLSGTPTATGIYALTVTAANGIAPADTEIVTLTLNALPEVTSADQVIFETGKAGSFTVTATGYPVPTLSEVGALPAGVTFSASGVLSGTPAAGTGGTYPIQIWGTTTGPSVWVQNFTLYVTAPTFAVAVEGTNGALFVQAPQLSAGWHSLGGKITGPPAVVAPPSPAGTSPVTPQSPWFIATGTNKQLYVRSLTAGWQQLGDSGCLGSPAAFISDINGTETLTVACEGTNHALFYHLAAGSGPALPPFDGGWTSLGGTLTAPPAVASVNGVITFFVRGTNGRIYTRTETSGYTEQPWGCIGAPAAALQPATGITTFACQGTNHALFEATSSGSGWTGAVSLGGSLIGGPGVAATSEQIEFFGEGTDHEVFERTVAAGWTSLGGGVIGGAGATALS